MRTILIFVVFFFIPWSAAEAAVTFSEIAWMGSVTSANHEWLELHNDGAPIDVTGWMITDGMNLSITLSGTIPAGAHVVLERTSDASAPGTAFLIYTGALVNTGATLQLLRADGSIADQVSGGEDWSTIGGDNVTKETAQYTESGWVTAPATPGRAVTATEVTAATEARTIAESTSNPSTTVRSTGSAAAARRSGTGETVRLTLPDVTLQLSVAAQAVGYVHQPIALSVTPTGIGDTLLDSLQYEWNFGDGTIASGKAVTHVYNYPGTYVVTVYGNFKRQEQVARHEITILPVALSLTTNDAGDVQVNNDAPYELDLSGYRIRGTKTFVFPPRSIILPGATITIAKAQLGETIDRMVAVYDTADALLATRLPGERETLPSVQLAVIDRSPTPEISALSTARPVAPTDFVMATDNDTSELPENSLAGSMSADEQQPTGDSSIFPTAEAVGSVASVGAASPTWPARWPYMALAIILLIATLGIYATPRRQEK